MAGAVSKSEQLPPPPKRVGGEEGRAGVTEMPWQSQPSPRYPQYQRAKGGLPRPVHGSVLAVHLSTNLQSFPQVPDVPCWLPCSGHIKTRSSILLFLPRQPCACPARKKRHHHDRSIDLGSNYKSITVHISDFGCCVLCPRLVSQKDCSILH